MSRHISGIFAVVVGKFSPFDNFPERAEASIIRLVLEHAKSVEKNCFNLSSHVLVVKKEARYNLKAVL
jgi:hypothetical protein